MSKYITREEYRKLWDKYSGYDGPGDTINRITYSDLEKLLKELGIKIKQ